MSIRELRIPDAYVVTPRQFQDARGVFLEWYRFDELASVAGHPLELRQGNLSVSRRGVLRGIHFADIPPGQAKYVTCPSGAVIDFVVDIRAGSPTFGEWESVVLDDVDRRAVYLAEGLGHAFLSLADNSTVTYLVSTTFDPARERGIHPLDAEIGLSLPEDIGQPLISDKDAAAPSLAEARDLDLLPTWEQSRSLYSSMNTGVI